VPTQIVTLSIAGANAQQQQVQVALDSSGTGTATFAYSGINSGTDTITAVMTADGQQLASNAAQVNWQQTNGSIQIGPVTAYMWNDSPTSGPSSTGTYSKFNSNDPASGSMPSGCSILSMSSGYAGNSTAGNSLFVINNRPSGSDEAPIEWAVLDGNGNVLSTPEVFPSVSQGFNMVFTGSLVVPAAGTYSMNVLSQDDVNIGIGGGATFTAATGASGQTITAMNGYGIAFAGLNSESNDSYHINRSASITFAAPGIYPIEVNWDYWYHSGRVMQITFNGANPTPVTLTSVPPQQTPTGKLIVTPGGGSTNLLLQGNTIQLTIQINGITLTSTPYLPLFEGNAGQVFISGGVNSTAPYYGLPVVPGSVTPSTPAAVAELFSVSADNTTLQGLLSLQASTLAGQPVIQLAYSGTAVPANVTSTEVSVQQTDMAWYNGANQDFDSFTPTSAGGGSSTAVQVNWLVNPVISGISGSLVANGQQQTLVVSLAKNLPPIQDNISVNFTISGGVTLNEVSINTNAQGFVTGWNLTVTPPVLYTATTITIGVTGNAPLTYLSGIAFQIAQTVQYFNGGVSFPVALAASTD
jgi:hypothetical protein